MIGPPVSDTLVPRTRPSVVSMAMVRTVLSPQMLGDLEDEVAVRDIDLEPHSGSPGSTPSNCTSTTAPMTWVIVPHTGIGHDFFPLNETSL